MDQLSTATRRSAARRSVGGMRRVGTAGAAVAAVLLGVLAGPAAGSVPATHERPEAGYVLRATPGTAAAVERVVRAIGGHVDRQLAVINGMTVRLSPAAARALAADPHIVSVTADAAVHLAASTYDPAADVNSLYNVEWDTTIHDQFDDSTGSGVDVALIDSGVSPVPGLTAVNKDGRAKLVYGPDLSPDSQNAATRNIDGFGHGTHLAGIIAGRDVAGAVTTSTPAAVFTGAAPDARIVSVKVADANGNTDVSQVLAAIDWVVQHAHDPGFNMRVLNLSFGTDSSQSYLLDPLAYAAEQAWKHGIVVVTSAGNSGATSGRLTDPAIDPYVIAVGASDRNGTYGNVDDTIPAFSSRGDGTRNPDLVAPGTHIQSLRVPGSTIDTQYGATGAIDSRFFRGSGTSQSAAFVSGAVAQLLQMHQSWTPDQIKAVLTATAVRLPGADAQAQGAGLLNINAAVHATPALTQQAFVPATGAGSLEAARGSNHLTDTTGAVLTGEQDIFGAPFNAAGMASCAAGAVCWTGGNWNSRTWAGAAWAGSSWAAGAWDSRSWAGADWASRTWASRTWASRSWAGDSWQ